MKTRIIKKFSIKMIEGVGISKLKMDANKIVMVLTQEVNAVQLFVFCFIEWKWFVNFWSYINLSERERDRERQREREKEKESNENEQQDLLKKR